MAITWVDNGTEFGSNPPFIRRVGYEETARTATAVTFKVYLQLKINKSTSASFYGYPMVWGCGSGTLTVKGSERWYGGEAYRQFTSTVTKSVGTGGGSVSVTVTVTSTGGGSNSFSKAYSFSYSSFNTAPSWPSGSVLKVQENNSSGRVISNTPDGAENAVKIAENISQIYMSWNAAADADNNISKYNLYAQVDDGTWSLIYSGTNRYYTHSIGSGASTQGKKYDYYVQAVDSYGLTSTHLDASQFQKNVLTGARLTVANGITYSVTSTAVTFSGASNTNGNTSFTYKLSSPQVTIYNPTITGNTTLTVYKSGTAPSTPYVKFDDLKNLTKSSNYTGSFTLELTTTNAYGSTAKSTYGISVNLHVNPIAPTTLTVSGKTTVNGASYLIPSKGNVSLSWSGASCPLGTSLTYNVAYALSDGNYVTVASGLTSTSVSFKMNSVTAATAVTFRVQVVNAINYGATKTVSDTLHYYSPPTISFSSANRTATSHSVVATIKTNSSISSVAISSRSYTGFNGAATSFSNNTQTISETGLTESSTYTLSVTVKDNSGLSEGTVTSVFKVNAATPMFSIREKGVGVKCVPSGDYTFKVNGTANITSDLKVNGSSVYHAGKTNKSGAWWGGNPAIVQTDGVVEAGKYIDFHLTNTATTDNDGRITLNAANDWSFSGAVTATKLTSNGDTNVKGQLQLSNTAFPGASTPKILVNTSADSNGAGDGNTHIAYNSGSKYSHYFRGKGKTYIDTHEGMQVAYTSNFNGGLNANSTLTVTKYFEMKPFSADYGSGSRMQSYYSAKDKKLIMQVREDAGGTPGLHIQTGGHITAAQFNSTGSMYGANAFISGGEVRLQAANGSVSTDSGYLVLRSASDKEIYIQGSQTRIVAPLTTGTYRPIYASAFTNMSTGTSKMNIKSIGSDDRIDTMQLLKDTNVYTYHLTEEVERGYYHNKKIGFIAEATPRELKAEGEQAIDLYSMTSTLWDVCKKQQDTIESQQEQIEELWEMVTVLCDDKNVAI